MHITMKNKSKIRLLSNDEPLMLKSKLIELTKYTTKRIIPITYEIKDNVRFSNLLLNPSKSVIMINNMAKTSKNINAKKYCGIVLIQASNIIIAIVRNINSFLFIKNSPLVYNLCSNFLGLKK